MKRELLFRIAFIIVFIFSLLQFFALPVFAAKDCSLTSVGFIPLVDMTAEDIYKGQEGGLYGSGMNEAPPAHFEIALQSANSIEPLDVNGIPSKRGKIGFISVGMSNTFQEFDAFEFRAASDPDVNASIVTVNGAQSGKSADRWVAEEEVWEELFSRISTAGLSKKQVQAVWLKQANRDTTETSGLDDALLLKNNLASIVTRLGTEFENLQVIYFSSRIYAGYVTGAHSSVEPLAYESAFAVRWLIQDQMEVENLGGTSQIDYTNTPALVWGPYLWADGLGPDGVVGGVPGRSDGLEWLCEDFQDDGGHPSGIGEEKVGGMLINWLKTQDLAKFWFLNQNGISQAPTATPTPGSTNTPTDPATATPTPSPTEGNSRTPTPTFSPTPTLTPTNTATPTATPTLSLSPTPTFTPTQTATPTSTPVSLNNPPVLATTSLVSGSVGNSYSASLKGADEDEMDTLSMSGSNLPPGLSLGNCISAVSGGVKKLACELAGVPTTAGSYDSIITISDDKGGSDSKTFTIVIN